MKRTPDDFAAEMAGRGTDQLGVAIDTAVAEPIDQNRRELPDGLSQESPSSDTDIIAAAQAAAQRLVSGQSYEDWKAVGRAALILRTQAMVQAGTNKPEGKHYAAALARKLADAKLDKILGSRTHTALRCRLFNMMDRISAVDAWLATLPTNRRLELNYPPTVWRHWQKSTDVPDPNKQPKPSLTAKLRDSVIALSEENRRLKEANGGSILSPSDTARDVVAVLHGMFSPNKLAEIRRLLGKAQATDARE
jgi:hypothetical protein